MTDDDRIFDPDATISEVLAYVYATAGGGPTIRQTLDMMADDKCPMTRKDLEEAAKEIDEAGMPAAAKCIRAEAKRAPETNPYIRCPYQKDSIHADYWITQQQKKPGFDINKVRFLRMD